MKAKRSAFSLSEILIILLIMSLITVLMLQNMKNSKLGYKTLYYFTLKNVQQSSGELVSESKSSSLDADDATFCSKLIRVFNTVGYDSVCGPQYSGSSLTAPFAGLSESVLDTPSFVISNGQRFYISTRVPVVPGYRIVNVDLNGKASPNVADRDIVAFAIFDNGEVLPLGTAADSKDYLMVNTKVLSKASGKQTTPGFVSDSEDSKLLSYRQGVCVAGYTLPYDMYCSSGAGFLNTYSVDDNCNPTNSLTFCRVNYVKPLINANI